MPDEPTEVVARFLRRANEILRSEGSTIRRGGLSLVGNVAASLGESVEILEETSEFQAMQKSIEAYLNGTGFGSGGWKGAIQNWLRRSGLYHRVAAGEDIRDADWVLASLLRELSRRESTATYFALLEHVSFSKRRMEFQRYEIVRFAKDELDRLLETQIRGDF